MLKKLDPVAYYSGFLSNSIRPDGRSLEEYRKVTISSNIVSLGKTIIQSTISRTSAQSSIETPHLGVVLFNVNLTGLASLKYEDNNARNGAKVDESHFLEEFLNDTFIRSGAVDLSLLCIGEGKLVWHITVTLTAISVDGNLRDAFVLASVSPSFIHDSSPSLN